MSCRPVRQTAKMQDLCFVTAYGSNLILTRCTVQSITSKSALSLPATSRIQEIQL